MSAETEFFRSELDFTANLIRYAMAMARTHCGIAQQFERGLPARGP